MSLLTARFPIEDPDMDRAELRDEAGRRLIKAAATRGWKLTAPPRTQVRHEIREVWVHANTSEKTTEQIDFTL